MSVVVTGVTGHLGRLVVENLLVAGLARGLQVRRTAFADRASPDVSALVLAPEHKATEGLIRDSGVPSRLHVRCVLRADRGRARRRRARTAW